MSHHNLVDHGSEGGDPQPRPQPQPEDPVSAPLDAQWSKTV